MPKILPREREDELILASRNKGKYPLFEDIQCQVVSPAKAIYLLRWRVGDVAGFTFFEGAPSKRGFESAKLRALLDSVGKTDVLTYHEAHEFGDRVPFGIWAGRNVEDAPDAFLRHWAEKDMSAEEDSTIRDFIRICKKIVR